MGGGEGGVVGLEERRRRRWMRWIVRRRRARKVRVRERDRASFVVGGRVVAGKEEGDVAEVEVEVAGEGSAGGSVGLCVGVERALEEVADEVDMLLLVTVLDSTSAMGDPFASRETPFFLAQQVTSLSQQ